MVVGKMRGTKIFGILLCVMLFSSFFFVGVLAEEDSDFLVTAQININFVNATVFDVDIEMDVERVTAFENIYEKVDIQSLGGSTDYDDIITLGGIMQALRSVLADQIELSFKNTIIVPKYKTPRYENSLFVDGFNVSLSPEFFDMEGPESLNIHDFVNGILDMDGIVSYQLDLASSEGWNNTYSFILSDSLNSPSTNGNVIDGELVWSLDNWNGVLPTKSAVFSLESVNPTTSDLVKEDIELDFILDATQVDTTSLKVNILTNSVDVGKYDVVPSFVSNLDFVPADGVRLLIDNGFFTWDALFQYAVKNLTILIDSVIEQSSFNQSLDMVFTWDEESSTNCSSCYDIENMDSVPAIKAQLIDDNVNLVICDVSSRALFGLINVGAGVNVSTSDVNFGDNLENIGRNYSVSFVLPENIKLAGEAVYSWDKNSSISGLFSSDIASIYAGEKIDRRFDFELEKLELNLPSFLTGRTELTATVDIKETFDIFVSRTPDVMMLPSKIDLEYINADGFRLCAEEGVFSDLEIESFLNTYKDFFEIRASQLISGLDVTGYKDRDVFLDSLSWDGDIASMSEMVPVVVSSSSHSLYSIPFGLSVFPPEFNISEQLFNLEGSENQSVIYRFILPGGLTAEPVGSLKDSVVIGKLSDGRQYLEVVFNGDESVFNEVLNCRFTATPIYVLGLFLPCILSFIIVIILIIVILFIRRKKRGKGFKRSDKKVSESGGYDGQDYYVPPPPQE